MIRLVRLRFANDAYLGLTHIELSESDLIKENLTIEDFIEIIKSERFVKIHKQSFSQYINTNYISSIELIDLDENTMEEYDR